MRVEATTVDGKRVLTTLKHPGAKPTVFKDDSGRRILVLQNVHSAQEGE